MDLTEAFRNEDISKTDFFDFVVTPDVADSQQTLHFNRTLKSMGIFIDHQNNNNNGEYLQIKEEPNNNSTASMMLPEHGDNNMDGHFSEHAFWSGASCDKETVRLETAILEDLNKFCWNQDQEIIMNGAAVVTPPPPTSLCHKDGNTDGAIYTLTVLNGDHTTATWYRAPDAPVKEEEVQMQMNNAHQNLDLDSILSIFPQNNGHQPFETHLVTTMNGDLMYDDSGYATKDSGITVDPLGEEVAPFDNNNDWNLKNNNNSSADSLLRNALQGKSFLGRYAPPIKNGVKMNDGHVELRRALNSDPKTPTPSYDDDETAGIFSDNPSSAHSMEDILLSQLDAASYPEDYEKIKRIANEVAESVNHYCSMETNYIGDMGLQGSPITPVANTKTKKYNRNKQNAAMKASSHAAATAAGVRKERSLHHCSICSKGFKDKYSVNVHIRTHTGEKPFACSLCGKSFRQKAHLAKHYQTHIAQKNAAAAGVGAAGGAKAGGKRFAKTT